MVGGVVGDTVDDCGSGPATHDWAVRQRGLEFFGGHRTEDFDRVLECPIELRPRLGQRTHVLHFLYVGFEIHVEPFGTEGSLQEPVDGLSHVRHLLGSVNISAFGRNSESTSSSALDALSKIAFTFLSAPATGLPASVDILLSWVGSILSRRVSRPHCRVGNLSIECDRMIDWRPVSEFPKTVSWRLSCSPE